MSRRRRQTLRVALLAVVVNTLPALRPDVASAHGALERSQPASGAHLAEVPHALRLTFTEQPELHFTRIELLGSDNVRVSLDALRLDSARTVTADIRGQLVAGTYTVVWQVAGDDGHPTRGRFSFTIAPGARGLATSAGSGAPSGTATGREKESPPDAHFDPVSIPSGDGFGSQSPIYVAIRWALYAALIVVLGAVAFRLVVLRVLSHRAPSERTTAVIDPANLRAASLGATASVILAAIAIARLIAQSYAMHGSSQALYADLIRAMLWHTLWGWGWLLQGAGVVVALLGFLAARRGRQAGWALAAVGALILALTPALSGHAASSPRLPVLAVASDALHVVAAAGWLGSLLVTIAIGVPAALALGLPERGTAVADLINAYSPTALAFAGLLAATGIFAGWLHVGTFSALWQSAYGRMLLVKLAVLSIAAGTGAYNWLRVRPALGDVAGARKIRRSASVELAVGALVLLVTAILVATPTPLDLPAMSP